MRPAGRAPISSLARASDPGLYDCDVLAWSEQQAALLGRLARGERVNGVDWENVIEEVESVGRSQFDWVRSNLRLAFLHALRITAWPDSPARAHQEGDVTAFLVNAQTRFGPGMRLRLDLAQPLRAGAA